MKRLFIALGLILCAVTFANAQGGRMMGTPTERAERQITQLESLKLSADQKLKLTEVFLWSAKQMDSLRTTLTDAGDFTAMRAKMAPMQAETSKKVNAILNDEQKKGYEAILEERRSRMRGNN